VSTLSPSTPLSLGPTSFVQLSLDRLPVSTLRTDELSIDRNPTDQRARYWHNYTYYFITDQPWSIPALNLVASLSVDSSRPAKGRVAAKIFAIRSAPYFPDVREENQLGTTISFEDAVEMMSSATVLDSPMVSITHHHAGLSGADQIDQLINNDDGCEYHYAKEACH